jgi:hypothetical protein
MFLKIISSPLVNLGRENPFCFENMHLVHNRSRELSGWNNISILSKNHASIEKKWLTQIFFN